MRTTFCQHLFQRSKPWPTMAYTKLPRIGGPSQWYVWNICAFVIVADSASIDGNSRWLGTINALRRMIDNLLAW